MQRTIALALLALGLVALTAGSRQSGGDPNDDEVPMPKDLFAIPLRDIDGADTSLEPYRGRVLLIVNVASKCGFTGQYAGLQALQERYGERGFTVLGFPANDFMGQEPGSEAEIKTFCSTEYGVTFPMFAKLHVKGKEQHPLYSYLTAGGGNDDFAGKIGWNFNKFLIGPDGSILARFGSRTKPEDEKLIAALEAALAD